MVLYLLAIGLGFYEGDDDGKMAVVFLDPYFGKVKHFVTGIDVLEAEAGRFHDSFSFKNGVAHHEVVAGSGHELYFQWVFFLEAVVFYCIFYQQLEGEGRQAPFLIFCIEVDVEADAAAIAGLQQVIVGLYKLKFQFEGGELRLVIPEEVAEYLGQFIEEGLCLDGIFANEGGEGVEVVEQEVGVYNALKLVELGTKLVFFQLLFLFFGIPHFGIMVQGLKTGQQEEENEDGVEKGIAPEAGGHFAVVDPYKRLCRILSGGFVGQEVAKPCTGHQDGGGIGQAGNDNCPQAQGGAKPVFVPFAAVVDQEAVALADQDDADEGNQGTHNPWPIGMQAHFIGIEYQDEGEHKDEYAEPLITNLYQYCKDLKPGEARLTNLQRKNRMAWNRQHCA